MEINEGLIRTPGVVEVVDVVAVGVAVLEGWEDEEGDDDAGLEEAGEEETGGDFALLLGDAFPCL